MNQIGHLTGIIGQMVRPETMVEHLKQVETSYDQKTDRWPGFRDVIIGNSRDNFRWTPTSREKIESNMLSRASGCNCISLSLVRPTVSFSPTSVNITPNWCCCIDTIFFSNTKIQVELVGFLW